MSQWSQMTIAKRARKRAAKLATFRDEGVGVYARDLSLKETNLDRGRLVHDKSVWGEAGGRGGVVHFGPKAPKLLIEEGIVHEFCHVAQHRLRAHRRNCGEPLRGADGHGRVFVSLLLSASAEFFKMTTAERKAVLKTWEAKKQTQKEGLAEHRAIIRNDVNRWGHKVDRRSDHSYSRPLELDRAYWEVRTSRIHGYLLDDAILEVLRERGER